MSEQKGSQESNEDMGESKNLIVWNWSKRKLESDTTTN